MRHAAARQKGSFWKETCKYKKFPVANHFLRGLAFSVGNDGPDLCLKKVDQAILNASTHLW